MPADFIGKIILVETIKASMGIDNQNVCEMGNKNYKNCYGKILIKRINNDYKTFIKKIALNFKDYET